MCRVSFVCNVCVCVYINFRFRIYFFVLDLRLAAIIQLTAVVVFLCLGTFIILYYNLDSSRAPRMIWRWRTATGCWRKMFGVLMMMMMTTIETVVGAVAEVMAIGEGRRRAAKRGVPGRGKKTTLFRCVCAARACISSSKLTAVVAGRSRGKRVSVGGVSQHQQNDHQQQHQHYHRRRRRLVSWARAATVEFDEYIDDEPWRAAATATTRQRTPPQHWPRPLCPVHSPYSRVPPPLSASAVDVMASGPGNGSVAGGSAYYSYDHPLQQQQHHLHHQHYHHRRYQPSYSHNYEPPPPSVRNRTTTPPPPNSVHRNLYWDTVVPPLPPSIYQRNNAGYSSTPFHHRSYHVSIFNSYVYTMGIVIEN